MRDGGGRSARRAAPQARGLADRGGRRLARARAVCPNHDAGAAGVRRGARGGRDDPPPQWSVGPRARPLRGAAGALPERTTDPLFEGAEGAEAAEVAETAEDAMSHDPIERAREVVRIEAAAVAALEQ